MAACGGCRFFVLTLRTLCGTSRSASPCVLPFTKHRTLSTSAGTCSLDPFPSGSRKTPAQVGKPERIFPSPGGVQRNLSAIAVPMQGQFRPLCRYDPLDLGDVEENTQKALACKHLRRFIVDPSLARIVTDHLAGDIDDGKAVIFECNPGPGVLTRALLNRGAQRVVALESDTNFLPDLKDLERKLDGQLDVVHCDFFKLDPIGHGSMKPPVMYSEKLFSDLAISEVPWTADVPVKIVGIFSQRNEKNILWKLIYNLFERRSIFHYGRVELIMFISQKEYKKLVTRPRDYKNYQAFNVLWQMACDIELLHEEPLSSFLTVTKKSGRPSSKNTLSQSDNLCLVRITPREDLFNSHLTPLNGSTLVLMVKQCLAKRKSRLIEQINSWSPGSGSELISKLSFLDDTMTGDVYPDEFKRLFELMEQSGNFTQSWLYEETLETTNTGHA
ncbi:dimethyladenosine transferase 2, mitochondrial-like [Carassius auratus]|uniref:rRNA adenine N(6)-methyltransferase n=1 Tax=Carassius auratus TaxID=7957 RepID=A0A6P6LMA8_CARAU|nr:dimethyladenosine transferase 2, mitochondrial-like [Carassius auratus]XP_026085649.1 dimethyladenosine transferase 2, mitochondrial-like [Carassius auratus]